MGLRIYGKHRNVLYQEGDNSSKSNRITTAKQQNYSLTRKYRYKFSMQFISKQSINVLKNNII